MENRWKSWIVRETLFLFILMIGATGYGQESAGKGKSKAQLENEQAQQACNDALAARKRGESVFKGKEERQKVWASGKSRILSEEDYIQEVCSKTTIGQQRTAEEAAAAPPEPEGGGPEPAAEPETEPTGEPEIGPEGGTVVEEGDIREPGGGIRGELPRGRPGSSEEDEEKKEEDDTVDTSEHDRDRTGHPEHPRHPRGHHGQGSDDKDKKDDTVDTSEHDRDRTGHPGHAGGHHPRQPASHEQGSQASHEKEKGRDISSPEKQHSQKLLEMSRKVSQPDSAKDVQGYSSPKAKRDNKGAETKERPPKGPSRTTPHHFSGESGSPGAASSGVGAASIDTAVGGSTSGSGKSGTSQDPSGGGGGGKGGM